MSNMELSPEPARGAVFVEQLRAVGLAMRREIIVFTVLLLGSWAFFAWLASRRIVGEFPFRPGMIEGFAVFAVAVPLLVWRAENPERRTYLWSLPLSRRSGHLGKVASGWVWTMVAGALVVFWCWAMAAVTSSPILVTTAFIEGAWYTYPLPAWLVLVPFGLATFLYLLGSAVVLSTNHPYRWGVGLYGLLLLLALGAEAASDRNGFLQRLMGNEAPYGLGTLGNPEVTRAETINGVSWPAGLPRVDFSNWVVAIALWGGLALIAAYVAATRHREP